jgi:hypothetical protein
MITRGPELSGKTLKQKILNDFCLCSILKRARSCSAHSKSLEISFQMPIVSQFHIYVIPVKIIFDLTRERTRRGKNVPRNKTDLSSPGKFTDSNANNLYSVNTAKWLG